MSYLPIGPKGKDFSVPFTQMAPSVSAMTLYTPATTSFVKHTPFSDTVMCHVAPVVTTESLIVATKIVHKIADATTITSDEATSDATDRLRATEFKNDFNTHVASVAYHLAAGTAITAADATSDPTLIALCQAIDAAMKAHAASITQHGGAADAVFLAALIALALPAVPTKGECRTWLVDAALVIPWTAHLAVTDLSTYITWPAARMPLEWPCNGAFWAKTNVSGHSFVVAEFLIP